MRKRQAEDDLSRKLKRRKLDDGERHERSITRKSCGRSRLREVVPSWRWGKL